MSIGYQDIKLLARNFDEFKELTKTTGELAKMKYIKFLRMRSEIHRAYKDKLKYVKETNFEKVCDARAREVNLTENMLKHF